MEEPEWLLLVLRQSGEKASRSAVPGRGLGRPAPPAERVVRWFADALVLAVAVLVAFLPTVALLVLAGLVVLAGMALIWTLARRRGRILGGIALVAVVIVVLTLAPLWVLAAFALLLASATAFVMAQRAAAAAEEADDKSIALWKLRNRKDAGSKDPL